MNAERAILSILKERGPEQTMCPSEATRLLPSSWASPKQQVWAAVHALYDAGRLQAEQEGSRSTLVRHPAPYVSAAWTERSVLVPQAKSAEA